LSPWCPQDRGSSLIVAIGATVFEARAALATIARVVVGHWWHGG
jgi:hypothetical protein